MSSLLLLLLLVTRTSAWPNAMPGRVQFCPEGGEDLEPGWLSGIENLCEENDMDQVGDVRKRTFILWKESEYVCCVARNGGKGK